MNNYLGLNVTAVLITLVVSFVILLICREIVCWYWKINRAVDLLENIHAELVAARKPKEDAFQSKYNKT